MDMLEDHGFFLVVIKGFRTPAVLSIWTNSGREWKPEKGKLPERVGRKATGLHPGKLGHGSRVAGRARTSSGCALLHGFSR